MKRNPIDDTTARFLSSLWQGGAWAYFWYLDAVETYEDRDGVEQAKKRSVWFPTGKMPTFTNAGATEHTFFGIHPTNEQRKPYQRAKKEYIAAVNCLFCEFDGNQSYEEVLAIEPRPSYVAESSPGKYHCYWLLAETYHITNETERRYIQKLQAAWVRYCEGDDGSKDLEHVLRVPGTLNVKQKYAPDYPLVTWRYSEGQAYPLATLHTAAACVLEAQAAVEKPQETGGGLLTGNGDVIGAFNERYTVAQCLAQYGYTQRGQRWVRPGGSRALVVVEGNRSFHHSGDDAMSDGYWHKPFDLFCHYEHNGDVRAAVKSAAGALGLSRSAPTTPNAAAARNGAATTTRRLRNGDGGDDQAAHTESDAVQGATGMKGLAVYADILTTLQGVGFADAGYDELTGDTVGITKDGAHIRIDDMTMAKIRGYAYELGYGSSGKGIGKYDNGFLAYIGETRINAIEDFFDNLPAWDGRDHIAQLASHLTVDNDTPITYSDGTQRMLSHAYLRRWLISVPLKALHGRQSAMLVLGHNNQGIGKSTLVEWLCPGGLYRKEKVNLSDKDTEIALAGHLIWEIEELRGFENASQEALKSFITKTEIKKRLPYGRRETVMPARCSLVGTTNRPDFLTDDTGNRRYMIVEVSHIDWDYQKNIDHAQLWAQALHLANSGEQALPSDVERAAQAAHNELYGNDTGIAGVVRAYLEYTGNEDDAITTGELMLHINGAAGQTVITDRHIKNRSVAAGIRASGATCQKTRSVTRYTGVRLRENPDWRQGTVALPHTTYHTYHTTQHGITKPCGMCGMSKGKKTMDDSVGDGSLPQKVLANDIPHTTQTNNTASQSQNNIPHHIPHHTPHTTHLPTATTQPATRHQTALASPHTTQDTPQDTPGMASRQEMLDFLRKHTDLPEDLYPTYSDEELAGFVEMVLHPDDDDDDDDGPASDAQGDGATLERRQELLAFLRAHTDIPEELYPTYTNEEMAGFVEMVLNPDDDDDDDDDDEPDDDDDGPASDAAPNVPGNPPPTNGYGPASEAAPNGNGNDEQRWWGGKPIISDKRLALLWRLPAHISSLGKTDDELEQLIAQSEGKMDNLDRL